MQDALDYAANRDKTEQSCFESSYACTLETAFADMRQTKERWHKSGGVQGYHLVQSFAAGEVTPELAHQIAKELADRVLGGRYEYVIGTHLNTGHIHSHIVWNSVSCVDGKKYRSNYKSYVTEIRAVSDELCRKYKLSIIDTENSNHVAKPYAEWLAEKNNQPTWRTAIRQDVDEAIQQSLTWRQFLTVLDRKGYEVRMGRKYPILRPPGKERFVRFKTLGKRYTPEAIQTRILYPQNYRPYVEKAPSVQHGRLHSGKKPHRKLTGLRALYYCRVSTEEEEQQSSFETQKLYYTEKITSTPEWEIAGIYADDGISGVHTKKRDGFNQMIQDCKKRKIDLILTKSISRFARNTLDSIQYVRMLKALGIAVIFEKENINTSTMNSEMILTVLSAFAQAESESISQNVARGKRMGFRQGKFPFPYRQILGYRKGSDGKPEIIPEEAEVIRMIFNSYLQGASLQTIKKRLEADGVLTARGNKKWSSESVQRILQNEKYCGDVLLQKTFIEDVLTGVSKKNTGQLPQYYIENNHEGIVTKQTFREAQAEIARRNSKSATNHRKRHRGRYNSKYALSERLVCGDCGSSYKRVTWSIHGRKQIVWRCVNRLEYGTKFCSNSPSIPETELHQAILKAVQNLAAKFTGEVADQLNGILHQIEVGESLTPQLQAQLEQNQQEFDHLLEMSLDFDENTPFLDDKLKRLSDKIKQLKTAITQSSVNSQTPSTPTNPITAKDLLITEYDDMLTARIIEKIIVKSRQDLEIIFIGGYTQQISLQ